MSCLLLPDCLNEVFENLEDDKITLHSCLLVSRLWCKISVRIFWRDVLSFKYPIASAILGTLISCLPVESKELLHKNEIFISTPTSKPPLFDYAAFCKVLSVNKINQIIHEALQSDTSISSQNLKDKNYLILKEMLKMFINRISSLKTLYYSRNHNIVIPDIAIPDISFTSFPGARDCLADLSEFYCSSDIDYKLSQICHNLRSLTIYIESKISNDLKELVSSQNNLKYLKLSNYRGNYWVDIIPALMKHSNTLTKLHLYSDYIDQLQLSFVSSFLNLQEIEFSFDVPQFEDFKKLQFVTFPKLQSLKIPCRCPKLEYLMKFLENNGKNLKEVYIKECGNDLYLSMAKFCPNLKKFLFSNGELDMLKTIFGSCQDLEGIVIWHGGPFSNEKEVLKIVANHSPKNFYELKLIKSRSFPEDLESFFINWENRASKKSISLIFIDVYNSLEYMKIIKKYKNLGIIKKFEAGMYRHDDDLYL